MKRQNTSVVWFRQDLRLADNPALMAAIEQGDPIVPIFIWDPYQPGGWSLGTSSQWWLHQSLISLDTSLQSVGNRLTICQGPFLATLIGILDKIGATAVFWNQTNDPPLKKIDGDIIHNLQARHYFVKTFNASWLFTPGTLINKSGKPFQVFSPFWKQGLAGISVPKPLGKPTSVPLPQRCPDSVSIKALGLEDAIDPAKNFREFWTPGEDGARKQLNRFIKTGLSHYGTRRDRPDLCGTSRLSPHLRFGEIGPRQIWHRLNSQMKSKDDPLFTRNTLSFLRQLGWREFANHLLFYFPHTTTQPLRKTFQSIPWQTNRTHLKAWQCGGTGYPIVDAGMRELLATGWMHNRIRMVVASFLTKHLRISWRRGAEWFWENLVDAELANNTLGWQWVTGCGADAAPYFRIFNPVTQGLKFDPNGEYVRRWVPELTSLPYPWIHKPWEAPPDMLKEGRVTLGTTYPFPIVEHREARDRALHMFMALKARSVRAEKEI